MGQHMRCWYSKTCLKQPLKNRQICLKEKKDCLMKIFSKKLIQNKNQQISKMHENYPSMKELNILFIIFMACLGGSTEAQAISNIKEIKKRS